MTGRGDASRSAGAGKIYTTDKIESQRKMMFILNLYYRNKSQRGSTHTEIYLRDIVELKSILNHIVNTKF